MELDCKGKHIALPFRLGRKSLAVTNLLAYITAVKRFKIQAQWACTIKLLTAVIVAVS
jgi:hypothetical protein